MSSKPRFSILVPVYNALPYFEFALTSILGQSYSDYEVVLVDDGSTDGSGGVCDAFANAHANVTVIHQENAGLLFARQIALRRASGDYIVALDADDALRLDALERLSRVIDQHAPDIIGFSYARSLDFAVTPASQLPLVEGLYTGDSYDFFERTICGGHLISVWSKCCRRTVLGVDTDILAYRGLTYAEDLLQLIPLVALARSFYYLDDPLYFYRSNSQSCTAHYESQYASDLMVALKVFLQYAEHLGSGYLALARRSALMQVACLVHIMIKSGLPHEREVGELGSIQSYMESAGLWGPWSAGLRADKRWEMFALQKGWFGPLHASILAVENIKRLRDRRYLW